MLLSFLLLVSFFCLSQAQSWSLAATMSYHVHDTVVVPFNNQIWIIGGTADSGAGATDLVTSWKSSEGFITQAPLPVRRSQHGGVVFKNKIYIVGGLVGGLGSTSCLTYTLGVGWADFQSLPVATKYPAVDWTPALGGQIYAYGGSQNGVQTNAIYFTDGTAAWAQLQSSVPAAGSNALAASSVAHALIDDSTVAHYGDIYYGGGTVTGSPSRTPNLQHLKHGSTGDTWTAAGDSLIGIGTCCIYDTKATGYCGSCPVNSPGACGAACAAPVYVSQAGAFSKGKNFYLVGGSTAAGTTCSNQFISIDTENNQFWSKAGVDGTIPLSLSAMGYTKNCDGTFYIVGGIVGSDCGTSDPVAGYPNSAIYTLQLYSPALTCPSPLTPAPTPVPVNPTPAPVNPTPAPVNPTPTPKNPTPAPVNPTPAPVNPTPAPVNPTPAPVNPTPAPKNPTPAPVNPTPAPVNPTPAPVNPTPAPVNPTPAPKNPTPAPVNPTPAPVNPTPAPVNPTPAPVNPTPAPVNPTPAPVNPTPAPVNPNPTPAPVNPTPAPVNPNPTPAPVNPNPTPAPVNPNPTPAPVNPNPTPAPVNPNPTPAPVNPNPTPAPVNPNPTPAPVNPNPTPAPVNPNPTPAPVNPNPTPAPVNPNPTPAPVNPNPTPAPVNPNPTPAPVNPNPTPAPTPRTTPAPTPKATPAPPTPAPVKTGDDIKVETFSNSACTTDSAIMSVSVPYETCYPLLGKGLSFIGECPQGTSQVTLKFWNNEGCLGPNSPLSFTKDQAKCQAITGVPNVVAFRGTCLHLVGDVASSLTPSLITIAVLLAALVFLKRN